VLAPLPQAGIQIFPIRNLRNRSRPPTFEKLDSIFNMGLFITTGWHTAEWLEGVVAGQSHVIDVQLPLTTFENGSGNRFWIIPPELFGDTAKKLEGFHRAVQNGFRLFAGQRDGERSIRIGPGDQQYRDLPTPLGKVDVDLTEVCFGALAWVMAKRDKCFALVRPSS